MKIRPGSRNDKDDDGTNPYLSARRSWNEHVGGLAASRRLWQFVAMAALLIVVGCLAGIIVIAGQSKFVPYVVKVDALGDAVGVQRADVAAPVDQRIVKAQVGAFIESARTVTADIALERKDVVLVYGMLRHGDAGLRKMQEWFTSTPESAPLVRAASVVVDVQIVSVIPQSDKTWQVDWKETTVDRAGQQASRVVNMRALVTVMTQQPTAATTEAQLRVNPLGLYVTDFSWGPVA